MKLILAALFALSLLAADGYIDNGRCSICKREKRRSKVFIKQSNIVLTIAYICPEPFYDERGKWVQAKCEQAQPHRWAECSRGHVIDVVKQVEVPVLVADKITPGTEASWVTGTDGATGSTSLTVIDGGDLQGTAAVLYVENGKIVEKAAKNQ